MTFLPSYHRYMIFFPSHRILHVISFPLYSKYDERERTKRKLPPVRKWRKLQQPRSPLPLLRFEQHKVIVDQQSSTLVDLPTTFVNLPTTFENLPTTFVNLPTFVNRPTVVSAGEWDLTLGACTALGAHTVLRGTYRTRVTYCTRDTYCT